MWHGFASLSRWILKTHASLVARAPLLSLHHLCQTSGCSFTLLWNIPRSHSPAARRFNAPRCFCLIPLPTPHPHYPRVLFEVSVCVCVFVCGVVVGCEDRLPSTVVLFTKATCALSLSLLLSRTQKANVHALSSRSQSHTFAGSECRLLGWYVCAVALVTLNTLEPYAQFKGAREPAPLSLLLYTPVLCRRLAQPSGGKKHQGTVVR